MAAQPHAGSWLDRAIVGRIRHNVVSAEPVSSVPCRSTPLPLADRIPRKSRKLMLIGKFRTLTCRHVAVSRRGSTPTNLCATGKPSAGDLVRVGWRRLTDASREGQK